VERLKILSNEEVCRIHDTALGVLEKTGLIIHHEDLLKKLLDAGFKVNENKKRVWFLLSIILCSRFPRPTRFQMRPPWCRLGWGRGM